LNSAFSYMDLGLRYAASVMIEIHSFMKNLKHSIIIEMKIRKFCKYFENRIEKKTFVGDYHRKRR
jgi:hypothetical protein